MNIQIIQRLTEAKRLADDLSNLTLRQQRCNASLDVDCVFISSAIDYALSELLHSDSELAQSLESVPKVQAANSPDTCPNCRGLGFLFLDEECPLCCGSGEYTQDYEAHYQSIRAVPYVVPVQPDWFDNQEAL